MNGNQGLACLDFQSNGITLSGRVLPAVELAAEAIENEVGYRRLSGTVLAANYIYAAMKRFVVCDAAFTRYPNPLQCKK